ncbi:glycosyl hydrolase family 18 protein [Paenibacillus sp. GCM10023252]|uniref:glycosyl hydrolase family 18 protein n=1 Tax=Paenibacillus sp. GCM10023252 TaxID=3252649 RepID=UPI003621EB72
MKWKMTAGLAFLLAVQSLFSSLAFSAAAVSQTTNYRVYQNDQALKEFATQQQAVAYAKYFTYTHVEKIAGRAWVWDNFPKFKLYQYGKSSTSLEFRTYEEALAKAKTLKNVHIRNLEQPGWVYQSYAKFQLYQGDSTSSKWGFLTLAEAKREAAKWGNAHIIDLTTNKWVWVNVTAAAEAKLRAGSKVYQITVDGEAAPNSKTYGYLADAIAASAMVGGSEVTNTATGKIVHSNVPSYTMLQSGKLVKSFISLDAALQFAKYYSNAEVIRDGLVMWTNIPYLTAYQGDKKVKSFHTIGGAIAFAKYYSNVYIRTPDNRSLWNNAKKLTYLGWNGTSSTTTVLAHIANTQGLNIDSPTWFELGAADGTLIDQSDEELAALMKEKGIGLMPLVHNKFDRKMTTAFLANAKAQQNFIAAIVGRVASLGAMGINLDFEEVAGADRAKYTAFVTALAKASHAKGLKLTIDLPRGSLSWNHQTAYDHAALAGVVDTIMIMAYDQYWSGSTSPGPVAGLSWTEEGVKQFLSYGIPRSKLMLGIPFYVREWKLDGAGKLVGNRAIYMKEVPKLITDKGASGVYDSVHGQYKYTYTENGFTYLFWAETPETVKARINIAKQYDLAGVAAWRLGYENGDLWTMMLRMK